MGISLSSSRESINSIYSIGEKATNLAELEESLEITTMCDSISV
jgi:hypothetical protein